MLFIVIISALAILFLLVDILTIWQPVAAERQFIAMQRAIPLDPLRPRNLNNWIQYRKIVDVLFLLLFVVIFLASLKSYCVEWVPIVLLSIALLLTAWCLTKATLKKLADIFPKGVTGEIITDNAKLNNAIRQLTWWLIGTAAFLTMIALGILMYAWASV